MRYRQYALRTPHRYHKYWNCRHRKLVLRHPGLEGADIGFKMGWVAKPGPDKPKSAAQKTGNRKRLRLVGLVRLMLHPPLTHHQKASLC